MRLSEQWRDSEDDVMTTTAADWIPARADVGFAAGYLVLGTVLHLAGMGGAGLNPLDPDVPASAWAVVVGLGCIGVAYRSTHLYFMLALTGAALLVSVPLGGSVFSLFFTFELIFCAALFGTRRMARVALVVAVLLTVAAVSRDDPDLDRRVLGQVRTDSVTALEQMRAMIDLLHEEMPSGPSLDRMAGGIPQLETLAESARLSGSDVVVTADPEIELPLLVDSTIYRIAQEALTNCTKHAPGQPISLNVKTIDGVAQIEVVNPMLNAGGGRSTTADGERAGHGLRNMRLRAEQLGGAFTAGEEEGWWCVSASLPIHKRTGALS